MHNVMCCTDKSNNSVLFFSFNKRKYQEIMSERAAEAAGKMNKKHKFHKKK